jgi:hypothetical protein
MTMAVAAAAAVAAWHTTALCVVVSVPSSASNRSIALESCHQVVSIDRPIDRSIEQCMPESFDPGRPPQPSHFSQKHRPALHTWVLLLVFAAAAAAAAAAAPVIVIGAVATAAASSPDGSWWWIGHRSPPSPDRRLAARRSNWPELNWIDFQNEGINQECALTLLIIDRLTQINIRHQKPENGIFLEMGRRLGR